MTVIATGNGRRILVVDDDEHTRNLLRDLCEQTGFRVETAVHGVHALEQLASELPDLVLLDLMMPHKDGFTVLKELRASTRTADLPVIILTAIGDIDGKIRGMELGADDYVTKPFKLIELQTRINSALLVRDYRRKLQAAEDQLAELRAVDPLTGAGTYSQLKASLDAELARSRRYGRPVSALLLTLEELQSLRFELGRQKADAFLAELIGRIRETLRGADRIFRLDLDEFVVLLPETDLRGARVTGERLWKLVTAVQPDGRSGPLSLRARVSGASFPHDRLQSSEDLLREANRVYQSTRDAGPERCVFEL